MRLTQSSNSAPVTLPTANGIPKGTPWLVTVEVLSTVFADAGKTSPAIRADIFKADDRLNSRGERIAGNGLAAHGAIIRRGRKVLIDAHSYGNWLAGRPPVKA